MSTISISDQINYFDDDIKHAEQKLKIILALKRLKSNEDFKLFYNNYTNDLLKTNVLNISDLDGNLNTKQLDMVKGISIFMNYINMLLGSERQTLDKIELLNAEKNQILADEGKENNE